MTGHSGMVPPRKGPHAVNPLSEVEARRALLLEMSEASNPDYFSAERSEHGWTFGWRADRGEPPMGTRAWIVADSGRVRMLGHSDVGEDAIAEEMAKG